MSHNFFTKIYVILANFVFLRFVVLVITNERIFFPILLTHTSPQPKELCLNLSNILKISFPFHYGTLQLDPGRTTPQDEN